ncbi:NUDIX domain-containing protein [Brachybacterium sp. YJGR34]|uniref:NUDIX domain-containing protein n=1 Tax=Brachybacterium sp. YJGR34 TaxID=2059911 RepID=UPI001E5E4EDD|nr:NUDIX domain-containing protein [Brachybacterium sp. YJGR34]
MTATGPRPRPPRRIILLAGPSGSGKGELSRRSDLPVLPLDEFYRDHDEPGLPRRFGIVDWDDPASWNAGAALEALTALAHDGAAEIPSYSIPDSRRVGTARLEAGTAPLLIAEGIFAAELIAPLRAAGLLADALVLDRPAPVVFALRGARDLREHRKAPLTLLRRGWSLARTQRGDVSAWIGAGMRPMRLHEAARWIHVLTACAEAERHLHGADHRQRILSITAVCFLRDGAAGAEVLAVRKRGTGSYMQVGGKLEPGESALDAAVRECEEEIGVRLAPSDLAPLGDYEAVAANEPDTRVRSTVWTTRAVLPEPLAVRAELADHRWVPVADPGVGARLAPLMTEHILPALRERLTVTDGG